MRLSFFRAVLFKFVGGIGMLLLVGEGVEKIHLRGWSTMEEGIFPSLINRDIHEFNLKIDYPSIE